MNIDVIFDIVLVTLLVLLTMLFRESPDLVDAVVYNLTDGKSGLHSQ